MKMWTYHLRFGSKTKLDTQPLSFTFKTENDPSWCLATSLSCCILLLSQRNWDVFRFKKWSGNKLHWIPTLGGAFSACPVEAINIHKCGSIKCDLMVVYTTLLFWYSQNFMNTWKEDTRWNYIKWNLHINIQEA